MEGCVAGAKGVIGADWEAGMSKGVEVVCFSDFCKDAGKEVMAGHV